MSYARLEQPMPDPLLQRLEAAGHVSEAARQALRDLPVTFRVFEARADIVRSGSSPSHCSLVVEGFVSRYKILPDGKRQIMGFGIPGDIPDLQGLHLPVMDHTVGALTHSTVALVSHQSLRDAMRHCPDLADMLWRETLVDAASLRERMIGIGRRTAYQRIAHLLCELYVRLRAVGLAGHGGYNLPVTQNELGDALGLSTVHVNRVLRDLRGEGLIVLRGGFLQIPDWEAMQGAAEFDPAYLHLENRCGESRLLHSDGQLRVRRPRNPSPAEVQQSH